MTPSTAMPIAGGLLAVDRPRDFQHLKYAVQFLPPSWQVSGLA